ncbi:sulfatase-like hydrolase/transferase [Akkermansiaceae bacterium]|nr:sulfatase-like hydrolase/transferase [Akkermansiaceae bacterium]MDA7937225.1 sulfatase-like hydrolase/transferase [bacterium]MDB4455369.1 sulfatase-like hydrolase/transferase [Akkermansiaceae bacterium]MDB4471895.1 sulfatase-like hydrolase/transferase [Akkermansiaceae bacterium]MDB4555969.1 sulfatase-like hydrolase/transferase [Akkermansiaceae bacterium]
MKHLLTFTAGLTLALSGADRPNILFIFSDDHAPNAISCYPGGLFDEIAPTKGIDRIAREGMRFDRSYCTNAICGPSRASILTGKHSHLNGFIDNNSSYFDGLQTTFPDLLRKAGYTTAMIGKWHLHSNPIGFDYWEILPGQGAYYNPDFIQMDNTRKRFQGHCNDLVTQKGLTWLKQAADSKKPFMAMVQYKAPHRNWAPAFRHINMFDDVNMPEPETLFDNYENRSSVLKEHAMGIQDHMSWGNDMKMQGKNLFPSHFTGGPGNGQFNRLSDQDKKTFISAYEDENKQFIKEMKAGKLDQKAITSWKYQRYIKDYLAVIQSMDEGIAKILNHLDNSGLAENTIVIYSSDQGFYLGEHGWYDKRWMFEESLMMPFVVRWPGKIKPGSVSNTIIQNIDYGPTFLELAGAKTPESMQGKSLVPIFKAAGEKPKGWRDSIYYRYSGERTHNVAAHDGVRTADHKIFWVPKTKEYQLFDMKKDPQEMKSVHNDPAYAVVFNEMKQELDSARKKYRVHSAIIGEPRKDEWWMKRHQSMNKNAKKPHDLLFIGDSITQGWEGSGKGTWEKYYGNRKALNLGISGDRTEHVIWRLDNGNLRNQKKAKAAVVMIGTNNTGHIMQDPTEVRDGVERIVSTLRARCPQAKILLLGVFPRGVKPDDAKRKNNLEINKFISELHNGERIHYLDISDKFLTAEGILTKQVMPDALHPRQKGYEIWAEAIEPKLKEFGL